MAIGDQPPAGAIGAASPGGSNPLGLPEAEDLLAQEQLEAAAQRALEERPSLGIRTRITGGFLLMLVLITGITVTSWVLLSSVERKLQLLVLVDRLTIEVQQARRFEKNYFLYHTNLSDALDHARQARELLASHLQGGERDVAVTETNLGVLARQLEQYEGLLAALASPDPGRPVAEIEAGVRDHGARTTSMVLDMAGRERRLVEEMVGFAKRVPLASLVITLFLSLVLANFLARQILGPLTRLANATRRVAAGDFTPLMPARRYKDEFSSLAMALNRMTHELERRYRILTESHKLRAVGTLTAGIAHELNNPLNNMMLTATTLRHFHAKLDEAQRLEMLDDIVSQGERCQTIARNLLDFTRQSEPRVEPLDLGGLLEGVVNLAQIRFHGCEVTVSLPPDLSGIHGDRNLLSQVFLNLLLNAVDAIEDKRKGQIEVRAANQPGGFVAVDIVDNGCGIPPHIIRSIFDPFFSTKSGKGTGLGLSMAQGIVRKHGGEIRVASLVGAGSTFTVLLPATPVLASTRTDTAVSA